VYTSKASQLFVDAEVSLTTLYRSFVCAVQPTVDKSFCDPLPAVQALDSAPPTTDLRLNDECWLEAIGDNS